MDLFEHCTAHVTSLEQDGFLIKIHAQVPSDHGVSGRELLSRVDQISGHLRRVKGCDSISRGDLAFARIEDNFHRVRALGDNLEGRVAVRFIDYGREDVLLLSDIIVVDPPLSDVLTTVRPLAEDFYLDGVLLMRPLSNEEIVVLSEKILYRTVSCRLRRLHPELSLIEVALASTNAAGDRRELFSNLVIEQGFGKKCTSEDIANYLRIKITARADEPAMQPGRPFTSNPYSVPPPNILGSQPVTMLGSQTTPLMGSQPSMIQTHSSVNARLSRFKKDAALNISGPGGNLYSQANSPPPQLADRKQYAVTDGRTCTTAPTLPVTSTHNAYISHVEDGPFNFTIQLKSSVEELLPKLRNILVSYQNSPITAQLIPGSVVMAKSSDETLRRGVIMNVQPETCKVYYIDYGNFDELPYSDIFQLPNTAAELSPAMAMQFCLADLKSIKITDSNKDYFARLLLGKQVLIRVTERESNSPFQYCEILWEGRNVREILLNLNSPMQYSYQYPPGGREAVSVIYADGPSQFFIQYRSELNVANQIQEALASYCPSQPRVTDLSAINIGSPVASLFPDDQSWYRALVMGMDSNNINVFYVDYGNRAEVKPNHICLLSRDLVNKWKTQAVECCLIGFDTVTPDVFMAEKMEDVTLGRSYTLRLYSILSGFRLSVDLLDDQGNSIATKMKNLLNERQKSINPQPSLTEKKKPLASHEDDRSSQHSSDSGGKKNRFQRPGLRSDRGNKLDQCVEKKFDDRKKPEERLNSYSQHDDRSGNDYKPRNDSRSDWKKGAKKPYMDQENEWNNSNQEPKSYAKKEGWGDKQEWGDKPSWGGDRGSRPDRGDRQGPDRTVGFRSDGDRKGGSNRFERKPFNNNDDGRHGDRGSRDRKFDGDRDTMFGDRDNRYGRDNKFGDRGNNRFGSRDNKFGDHDKFGSRDKPIIRDDRKQKWNEPGAVKSNVAAPSESWENDLETTPVKRPSVVISEYPHQEIKVGEEYKVLFAGMETSPREVYVQLSDCDPKLDKIRIMIEAYATATLRPISNVVLAMPVLARFQDDGLLYRATIRSISKVPSGQVDILFVDFGNTAVNPLNEVFTISSELMSTPIQAIHVIVSDMPTTPFPNLTACQAHFETDYLTLKPTRTTTINLEQVIEGTIIRPDGKSVADCVKNDPSCLGEAHVVVESENEAPVLETPFVEQTSIGDYVLWRERLDFLLGQRLFCKVVKKLKGDDVYSIKITAVLDLIVPAQSTDSLSSELNHGDDIIVAVEGLTEDKLLVKYYSRGGQSFGKETTTIDSIIPMQIVERRGTYTVIHREASTLYLQRENTTTLNSLLNSLFEKYEGSAADVCEFKIGDKCAAKSFDGNWYRAKISAVVENMFTVHYLDYGNKEEINVENLRKLDEEFNCPEMCVGVVLPVTIKDVEGCYHDLGDGPFDCTFIKLDIVNGVWIADLVSIGEKKEIFALKWIEEGKAESMSDVSADPLRREPSWNLRKGDRMPIVISHIELPDTFFAHLIEHSKVVDELQNQIRDLPDDSSDLDELFLAKYTEDSVWYRAVRVGDLVRFVDFGNLDPSVEMKKLPAQLIHPVKGYALPLRLCVRASGEQWTDEAIEIYESFIDKSGLEAEIISVDFETVVDLRVGDESLSTIYVNGGHAVRYSTPLMDKDLFDCILEGDLPSGIVPASVTAITSINDFYIQEDSKMEVLDLLASKLEAADSFEIIENPSLGQHLIAKFVDDSIWYRAKVIHQDSSGTEVLFVDYGNVSPATEFRVLPLDLAAFPSLSSRCSMDMEDTPPINDLFTSLVDAATVFDVSFGEKKGDVYIVQLTIDNNSPFELLTTPEVQNVEIPSPSAENIVEVQARPIPPALAKPLYKNCVLGHSNGPYDFYVQTDDDHIQIEEMANSLFEASTFPKIDGVKKGDFVVAQYTEDDAYYRAVVTDVEPEVVVHFIDYGNSCPASCFHELPAPLKDIPQLAIRCSLQSPIGGWSVDAIDKFTTLLNSETKSFDLNIMSSGDPTIVDVEINGSTITKQLAPDAKFEPDSIQEASLAVNDEGINLPSSGVCYIASITPKECYIHDSSVSAELDMINEELASIDVSDLNCELNDVKVGDLVGACHDEVLYRACITNLDPPEVYFVDYGNTSPVAKFFKLPDTIKNKKPLAVKVKLDFGEGISLSDDGLTELQTLADGGANYTQTNPNVVELQIGGNKVTDLLKSYLIVADSSGDTSESKSVLTETSDDAVAITISHANSPSDFYYQVDSSKVDEMSSRLVEAEGFLTIEKCDVGQIICAKFCEDELFYRARVLTTEPTVTVFFLDYGNVAEVKEMKQLPDDLAKIPPLCAKASLKPQNLPWTEEEVSKFVEIAFGNSDFTSSVIENGTDVVFVRLNSSEVGDVLAHLGRSCSIMTSDSEYGTPEVLSVNGIVPPDHVYDESAIEPSLQIIEQFADNIRIISVNLAEPNIEDESHSNVISRTPIDHVEDGSGISDQVASNTYIQDHNEFGSPDMLTLLPKGKQATPLEYSKDSSCESANRENSGILKDEQIVHTSAQTSPESESRVPGHLETLGETFSTATFKEVDCGNDLSTECQRVETFGDTCQSVATLEVDFDEVSLDDNNILEIDSQLNSPSNSLMALAQATLMPFVGEITTNYAKQKEVTSSPSDSLPFVHLESHNDSVMSVAPLDTINEVVNVLEDPVVVDEVQIVPENGSFFRLPNLKETLYAALGYQTPNVITDSSVTIIPSDSETHEGTNQSDMMNSSMVVNASATLNETLEDESYFGNQSVENISSQSLEGDISSVKIGETDPCMIIDATKDSTLDTVDDLQTEKLVGNLSTLEEKLVQAADVEAQGRTTVPLNLSLSDPQVNPDVLGNTSNLGESKMIHDVITGVTLDKVFKLSTAASAVSNVDEVLADHAAELIRELDSDDEIKTPLQFLGRSEDTNLSDPQVNPDVPGNTSNLGESKMIHSVISGISLDQVFKLSTAASNVDEILADQAAELIRELDSDDEIKAPLQFLERSEDSSTELNVTGSHIEAHIHTVVPLNFNDSDSQVKPDGCGNSSNQGESKVIFTCYGITPAQLMGTLSKAAPAASTTVERIDGTIAEHEDLSERQLTDKIGRTEPGCTTTTDDDEKPLILERSEDSKTEFNVAGSTVLAPIVSTDTAIHSRAGLVEIPTVPDEKEIASVKPVSKPALASTGLSKRIPIKTLAQIKASAKARISTGLSPKNSKNEPPSKLSSPRTHHLPTPPPDNVTTSPRSSSERDRLIPGTVNGRLDC